MQSIERKNRVMEHNRTFLLPSEEKKKKKEDDEEEE